MFARAFKCACVHAFVWMCVRARVNVCICGCMSCVYVLEEQPPNPNLFLRFEFLKDFSNFTILSAFHLNCCSPRMLFSTHRIKYTLSFVLLCLCPGHCSMQYIPYRVGTEVAIILCVLNYNINPRFIPFPWRKWDVEVFEKKYTSYFRHQISILSTRLQRCCMFLHSLEARF